MITAIYRIPPIEDGEGGIAFEHADAKKRYSIMWDSCAAASWRTWMDWRWTIPERSELVWSLQKQGQVFEGRSAYETFNAMDSVA